MDQFANSELRHLLHKKLENTFLRTIDNPVIKAQESWDLLNDQLLDILGPEVHTQWFRDITPLVLKNNILIVQTKTEFASQWINTYYQDLASALMKAQGKKKNCFFISKKAA